MKEPAQKLIDALLADRHGFITKAQLNAAYEEYRAELLGIESHPAETPDEDPF